MRAYSQERLKKPPYPLVNFVVNDDLLSVLFRTCDLFPSQQGFETVATFLF
jgi:hypothetical protein